MATFQWLRTRAAAAQRATRVPLSIYVIWHPGFADGRLLARTIAEWCGGATVDIRASGQGIPVHFRSEHWRTECALRPEEIPPEPEVPDEPVAARAHLRHAWRRPVELDEAEHNVFVPLVDDHMVADSSWRRDLIDIARHHRASRGDDGTVLVDSEAPKVHLIPIQITSAWGRMSEEVSGIQALFLRRWTDAGETNAERRERWVIRIRRLVTQALVRLLGEPARRPTEIFLSHAKADLALGPGVAEQLRDVAAAYGQIDVFYDENDLPAGKEWRGTMLGAAANTSGFIAVLSDRYATRFWCRREIQQARTPVRMSPDPRHDDHHVWTVRPSVVAVTMSREWTRLVGELGTVPAIMWRSDDANQAAVILDQLFREALIAEFQLLYARQLYRQLKQVVQGPVGAIAFVIWTPDASTLIRLRRQAGEAWADDTLVVYPGHGFLPTEEADLAGALGRKVAFCSFEQFADSVAPGTPPDWNNVRSQRSTSQRDMPELRAPAPLIALSAGDADDLAVLGYDTAEDRGDPSIAGGDGSRRSSLHVDAAVLRVCRVILEANLRIAYGGTLRSSAGFTQVLYDTVAALATSRRWSGTQEPLDDVADPETPLENWVPRPRESDYTARVRAELAGLCRFYVVGDTAPADASDDHKAAVLATALSASRQGIALRSAVTIAISGKRWGASGIMPGVAEEILCAMEAAGPLDASPARVRVFLIGEYGGVVREIARYILDRTQPLPSSLTLASQEAHPHSKLGQILRGDSALRAVVEARYAALARCLDALRVTAKLPGPTPLPRLGITVEVWRSVMTSSSIGYIRRLLKERVLPEVVARGGNRQP